MATLSLFNGQFGDGTGTWQLFIESDFKVYVMNLIEASDERLSVLN